MPQSQLPVATTEHQHQFIFCINLGIKEALQNPANSFTDMHNFYF